MNVRLAPRTALPLVLLFFASVLIAGCAPGTLTPPVEDNPLIGRIWDLRANRFVTPDDAMARAVAARIVILGEAHDNAEHHRLQARILESIVQSGRRPVLAMEQFDRENQPALDAARTRGERDPERIARDGHFDREGWRWPDYKPLIQLAARYGLALRAANLSREDARALMRSGKPPPDLPAAPALLRTALEADIIDGHCGHRPSSTTLAAMVNAQRARDAQMAKSLAHAGEDGVVLIAGAGHARRDRAVPFYLSTSERGGVLSLAFIEVESGKTAPGDYTDPAHDAGTEPGVDLIWFTPRAPREDPCINLRMPGAPAKD